MATKRKKKAKPKAKKVKSKLVKSSRKKIKTKKPTGCKLKNHEILEIWLNNFESMPV